MNDREQVTEELRDRLEDYLTNKGIDTRKPFLCLSPEHDDHSPSMSYDKDRKRVKCFSCGATFDLFDLIGIDYNLTNFTDQRKKAMDLFNLQDRPSSPPHPAGSPRDIPPDRPRTSRTAGHSAMDCGTQGNGSRDPGQAAAETGGADRGNDGQTDTKASKETVDYLQKCQKQLETMGTGKQYMSSRGISIETARRYGIGFGEYSKGKESFLALVIPTGGDSYVVRNTDPHADKKRRYRKHGPSKMFGVEAFAQDGPLFVVEGELDALSIVEAGGRAVALGSTANSGQFIKAVEDGQVKGLPVLALDNDQEGSEAADKMADIMAGNGLFFYRPDVGALYCGQKDANAALVSNRDNFTAQVKKAELGAIEAQEAIKEQAKQEYITENCTASFINAFIDGIAGSINTPYIPTGFPSLDVLLDGGLYEGLYVIGAISSLGKTTLITQVCDQVAQGKDNDAPQDVLIFSLEMARTELMAKSISRGTILRALDGEGDTKNAKTARGITTGKRYINYSPEEHQLIEKAVKSYSEYADHLFISEGVGDIGADQIRLAVQKHLTFTGNRPVVVVDYLQILAPYDVRATDKSNTDRAVLELKRISRDFKIPVIAISSFNRDNYKEAVSMKAFKESGAIEYSSDVLIGLQFQGVKEDGFDVTKAMAQDPRQVELKILKNRNGATGGSVYFDFYPKFNYFAETHGKRW